MLLGLLPNSGYISYLITKKRYMKKGNARFYIFYLYNMLFQSTCHLSKLFATFCILVYLILINLVLRAFQGPLWLVFSQFKI